MNHSPGFISQKVSYFIGLIALSILVPVNLLLKNSSFNLLMFLFWLTTVSLLIFSVLDSYFELQTLGENEEKKEKKGTIIQVFIVMKALSGFGLIAICAVSLVQFVASLFTYRYLLPFKLFLPLILLFVFGTMFLRDKETADWIDSKAKWLLPIIRKYSDIAMSKVTLLLTWVGSRKYVLIIIAAAVLIAALLPLLLKPPEIFTKQITISVATDSLVINHDYDQGLNLSVTNTGTDTTQVFLKARTLNQEDSLLVGFIGAGSEFEGIAPSTIYPGTTEPYSLIVHAANARLSSYEIQIQLFRYFQSKSDSVDLLDEKTITLQINSEPLNIEFEKRGDNPNTLGQYYKVTNNGSTISNFSVLPGDKLKGNIRMIPEIEDYRFEAGESIRVLVEPRLRIGFDELNGKLIASGGGAEPVEKSLSFSAPIGKKVWLAVARCGSKNHKLGDHCINLKNVKDELGGPPAFNNGAHEYSPGETPRSAHLTLVGEELLADTTAVEEEEEKEDILIVPEGDYGPGSTIELILAEVDVLDKIFDNIIEDFSSRGAQLRIRSAKEENLAAIRTIIGDKENLSAGEVDEINEHMYTALDTYHLMKSETVWNQRRESFIPEILPELTGLTNLRMDRESLKYNNGDAPNIAYTQSAVHFAWHYRAPTGSERQYILYSSYDRLGNIINHASDLTPDGENGRWPFMLEGTNGMAFLAWEASKDNEKPQIKLRVSSDSGREWGNPITITNNPGGAFSPQLVFKNDNLYVLWTDSLNGAAYLRYAHSSDNGSTFSEPVTLASGINGRETAKFDVTSDDIHFVYTSLLPSNENRVIYGRRSLTTPDPSTDLRYRMGNGYQPVVKVLNQDVHLAYSDGDDNQSEIIYRSSNDDGRSWTDNDPLTEDDSYSTSPSICFGADDKVRVFYHSNQADPEDDLDHIYYQDKTDQGWTETYRLPSLAGNGRGVFLSVNFRIPWNRREYGEYNVKVRFNGRLLDNLKNFVPEGSLLYPIDPSWVRADGQNEVNLVADHFSPAHYLITYGFSLIADMDFVEQLVFASSQEEADNLLAMDEKYNHDYPDLGLYALTEAPTFDYLENGDEVSMKVNLWNLGQAASQGAIIDIYGGPASLSKNALEDRYLLGQQEIDHIDPMQKIQLDLPFIYWSGLEKIVFRVRTKEKDFDESNNIHSVSMKALYAGAVESPFKGTLRIAVFDAPGELSDDVELKVYQHGNDTPIQTTSSNPGIWSLNTGRYDVYVKNRSASNVEQWIRGVSITPKESDYNRSYTQNNSVSLNILTQQIDETIRSLDKNAEVTDHQIKFQLPSSVLFHSGEFEINTYSIDYLKKVRVLLNAYPGSELLIEGHTDDVGDAQYNLTLSKKRAESVKNWLVNLEGIEEERLRTVGRGETQPAFTENTDEAKAKNRRVSFVLNRN